MIAAAIRATSADRGLERLGERAERGDHLRLNQRGRASSHDLMSRGAVRLMSSNVPVVMSGLTPACMKAVPSSVKTTWCDRSQRPYLPRGPSASTYSTKPGRVRLVPFLAGRRGLARRPAASPT